MTTTNNPNHHANPPMRYGASTWTSGGSGPPSPDELPRTGEALEAYLQRRGYAPVATLSYEVRAASGNRFLVLVRLGGQEYQVHAYGLGSLLKILRELFQAGRALQAGQAKEPRVSRAKKPRAKSVSSRTGGSAPGADASAN